MKHSDTEQLERMAEDLRTVANRIDLFLARKEDNHFVPTSVEFELRGEFHRVCCRLQAMTEQ